MPPTLDSTYLINLIRARNSTFGFVDFEQKMLGIFKGMLTPSNAVDTQELHKVLTYLSRYYMPLPGIEARLYYGLKRLLAENGLLYPSKIPVACADVCQDQINVPEAVPSCTLRMRGF